MGPLRVVACRRSDISCYGPLAAWPPCRMDFVDISHYVCLCVCVSVSLSVSHVHFSVVDSSLLTQRELCAFEAGTGALYDISFHDK